MHILIIGSGGREHALAWKIARSPQVTHIYVAPGNAGTSWPARENVAPATNISLNVNDINGLIAFAQSHQIALTIVGPEAPLAAGLTDAFLAHDLAVFGPTQAAAQLEASKAFAKQFMNDHNIPTGGWQSFTDYDQAKTYLASLPADKGLVLKADGLAAGKGVIICDNRAEAQAALDEIMVTAAFGAAGNTVLIEERLTGPEMSLLALCDGHTAVPLTPSRDHKRALDGDQGLNTGGMGAYAPLPDVDQTLIDEIMDTVIHPTIQGMAAQGTPYVGVLYAGIMLTPDGPKVLEFNCRFGDPETQVVLPMLATDLTTTLLACAQGTLDQVDVNLHDGACAAVIMSAPGYPQTYPKGLPISGISQAEALHDDIIIFHAGTKMDGDQLVTNGGRVLAVTARGADIDEALNRAYQAIEVVHFPDAHYRRDIGRTLTFQE
ncbi:MAG TPA: phosphoribosylamine--glycine ligase [Anaerolineae bacterium]|nr:phosphoribosylamine--glycine ligase [Anaerolineae bacterium]